MGIYSIFNLLGGLAFVLFGMTLISNALEKMSGGKLEALLKKSDSTPAKGLLLGGILTAALQSSSAVMVMLVGLVNSGILHLGQTASVIMGSNIGTTVTGWILALTGIENEHPAAQLLRADNFSAILAIAGVLLIMNFKSDKRKSIGSVLIGFAILMAGMNRAVIVFSETASSEFMTSFLSVLRNPFIGLLAGILFTGIIQSSAASVGILQAFTVTGGLTFSMAIPIVMGQNIGTCISSVISSKDANKNAQRVSLLHLLFNVIGTIILLAVYCLSSFFVEYAFDDVRVTFFGIAVIHTIFNAATCLILFPFRNRLEKLACVIVKDEKQSSDNDEVYSFIDIRLLSTPSVAIRESNSKCKKMAELAKDTIFEAFELLDKYDSAKARTIRENEDVLDMYEDKLGSFLVKLSSKEISERDGQSVSRQLHSIGDFERIGDHAMNILQLAEEMQDKKLHFSEKAKTETDILIGALTEIINSTINAYTTNNISLAKHIEPLEEAIDKLISDIKSEHIKRLKSGECSIELGFILSDLLANCERVSDHCSNLAIAIIETEQLSYDAHEYINDVKSKGNKEFQSEYEMYKNKYSI
ncbi:MAG: Na/Pi cotransporter family protein [Acutalibacteraceae bacterium]|nr:Na/Pi cotransporter family protein [Clostridia bacterium]MEE3449084.1 Na/Pi cotransporter family protein [Acutalibacteraceae bacterium]